MPSSRKRRVKKLTRARIRDYIKHGSCCPLCGSEAITGGHIEVDSSGAWQELNCADCLLIWQDVYQLVGVDNVVYPEADDDKGG